MRNVRHIQETDRRISTMKPKNPAMHIQMNVQSGNMECGTDADPECAFPTKTGSVPGIQCRAGFHNNRAATNATAACNSRNRTNDEKRMSVWETR